MHALIRPVPTRFHFMNVPMTLSESVKLLSGICCLALMTACGGGQSSGSTATAAVTPAVAQGASTATLATARALGRGINFGDMLDAPKEGIWSVKVSDPIYDEFIAKAAAAGFKTIRLPVRFSNNAALTADATIDPAFMAHVEDLTDRMLAYGLYVILDMHHYRQLDGDTLDPLEAEVAPSVVNTRFVNMWSQIAERFKNKSGRLLFNLYNEPHGRLTATAWNALSAETLAIVRKTNPARITMIGPVSYNTAWLLKDMKLPNDPNLIVDVHTYDPISFTFQGLPFYEPFQPAGVKCCSDKQKSDILIPLDIARQWSIANRYPIYIGEFGVSKFAGSSDRANYARYMRDQMEARDMSWAYWDFAGNFNVYDQDTKTYNIPLRDALLNP